MSSKPVIFLHQEYDDMFKSFRTKVITVEEHAVHGKGRKIHETRRKRSGEIRNIIYSEPQRKNNGNDHII